MKWEPNKDRLERRRIKRIAVTPESIALCGCWQIIAIRRERKHLGKNPKEDSDEVWYYVTSVALQEMTDAELLTAIRGHWGAIENGVHYRRDVTFGEDASRIANRKSAHAMAALRNLAIGIYELQANKAKVCAGGCKSWLRQMTPTSALKLLQT